MGSGKIEIGGGAERSQRGERVAILEFGQLALWSDFRFLGSQNFLRLGGDFVVFLEGSLVK